jgi:hypothetical protein
MTPTDGQRWWTLPSAAVSIVVLIVLSIWVRAYADADSEFIKPYMGTYYQDTLTAIGELPWWRLFLPLQEFGGRWGTTGFLLVHWLETVVGEPRTFYLLTAIMVTTGYALAYLTFRSLTLAFLFGFGLATSTFNYHVYAVSGSIIILPVVTFMLAFGYSQVELLRRPSLSPFWAVATAISCVVLALSYEGWLDVVPLVALVHPVLAYRYWRIGDRSRAYRCLLIALITAVVALAYIGI